MSTNDSPLKMEAWKDKSGKVWYAPLGAFDAARLDALGKLLEPHWPGDKFTLDYPLMSGDPWQVKIAEAMQEILDKEPPHEPK